MRSLGVYPCRGYYKCKPLPPFSPALCTPTNSFPPRHILCHVSTSHRPRAPWTEPRARMQFCFWKPFAPRILCEWCGADTWGLWCPVSGSLYLHCDIQNSQPVCHSLLSFPVFILVIYKQTRCLKVNMFMWSKRSKWLYISDSQPVGWDPFTGPPKTIRKSWVMAVYAFNSSRGWQISLGERSAWSTGLIPGQPRLHTQKKAVSKTRQDKQNKMKRPLEQNITIHNSGKTTVMK